MTSTEFKFGVSGLNQYGGVIQDEFLAKLQGIRGVKMYDEMRRNSPTVGAVLHLFSVLLEQMDWGFKPASDTPEAIAVADFYNGIFWDMDQSWPEVLGDVKSCMPFGWSYHEVVWKLRDGIGSRFNDHKIGVKKIALRPQDSLDHWEFDDSDNLLGMWQNAAPNYRKLFVPLATSLHFRIRPERGNPEGISVLRNSVIAYNYIKRLEQIECIGHERQTAGMPVIECPKEILSSTPTPVQASMRSYLEKIVRNVRRDEQEGILFPSEIDPSTNQASGYKFSLVAAAGGSHQVDADRTINRFKLDIYQNAMCEFIQLGNGSTGSWALADNKTKFTAMAVGAVADSICGTIERQFVPMVGKMNSIHHELWPVFDHGDIETPSLDEVGRFVSIADGLGYNVKTPDIERHMLSLAGLPVEEVK